MNIFKLISFIILILLGGGCVTEFIPETNDARQKLVVEGLITDQPVRNKVKLSLSMPIGDSLYSIPVHNAQVYVREYLGTSHKLTEIEPGSYYTNPAIFKGIPGHSYSLLILTLNGRYESPNVEMKPVPPIDSVYYEKIFVKLNQLGEPVEGAQIYIDTHDSLNNTKFFRWNYTETWIFRLPYNVQNNVCWITEESDKILLANTSYLAESSVSHFPIRKIATEKDDRLKERYSIMVNQYSISEEEFRYWEKIQKISERSGGLYDVTPMTVIGNIQNTIDPEEQVMGFFSVSAVSSRRIYIEDAFAGFKNLYTTCPFATVPINQTIRYLGEIYWIIIMNYDEGTKTYTDQYRCADCTTRGTTVKPDFWPDN
jgi:hypothetical protein